MGTSEIIRIVKNSIAGLKRKVLLTIGHGLIEAVKDSGDIQLVRATFLADETKSDVRKMHHFGFSSNPPKGSECIMASIGGNREAGVIIATENREFRFKNLGEGEVAIYSKDGDYIHLKDGNVIDVKTKALNIEASTEVNITSPTTNISGDLNVGGNETVEGNSDITGNETVGGDSTVTGDITGANITGVASVSSASISASSSMTVAGQELNDYENHTHQYEDDDGEEVITKTTGSVN